MLVLTRKSDEKILIGDDIVITVLRTKGKAVRLGIEAPSHMRVLRGEIAFDGAGSDRPSVAKEEPTQVSHARISRSERAAILPALTGEGGPLAAFVSNSTTGS